MALAAALLLLAAPAAAQRSHVDPATPDYRRVGGVAGNLDAIGSDTLNNLMTLWSETFRKLYPNVNVQVEGKGSSTAPPALAEGTAQLGPMSRAMKPGEIEAFEQRHGYKPTRIVVALDALAVFVNKDNPLTSLSLPQVDAIFSRNRRGGHPADIATWGDAGATGRWTRLPISLYGRNSASGTYGYFKEEALFKGDFKATVKEQPGSSAVVQGVTADRAGIGYSGIGYRTSGVKAIALSRKTGGPAYAPTYDNVLAGSYPLGRPLYIYVAKPPGAPLPPLVAEFLRFVLSRPGQQVVEKDGYLPLSEKMAAGQRALLP
ncbi:MAG: phosphate ABC transporter substrate-binding protein [Candidatus Lambdaproteobacteria bacterium]|nr:phosphate ABC transporter substrate-binding protein [Candidatus Lambdaproteobacteria bacterium]